VLDARQGFVLQRHRSVPDAIHAPLKFSSAVESRCCGSGEV
jgi:hypothetical protein